MENLAQMRNDLGTALVRFAPEGELFDVAAHFMGEVRLDPDLAIKPNERGRLMRLYLPQGVVKEEFVIGKSLVFINGQSWQVRNVKISGSSAPLCLEIVCLPRSRM